MKALSVSSPKQQRGSIYTTLILVAMFALFLVSALKIAPAYMDNAIIKDAMEGIAANNDMETMSITEIRTALMRTLNTNSVDNFDAGNVVLVREGGEEFIDINYESRAPLFYNIEAVVVFKNRFPKS